MPPPRRPATIPSTSAIGSISGTAPRGRRSETRLQLPDDRLALPGGQELRQVVRERRQPGGDLALALLGLEQLVRDVERGQDRRLVRLHDGTLRRPRASRSDLTLPPPPRAPLSFNSASALRARVRQPVSSSATCRRIVSSWSSTGPSALSPSYAKLVLQSREPPGQRRVHFRLAQRARRVAERAVPRDAALTGRDPGPTILVEHL